MSSLTNKMSVRYNQLKALGISHAEAFSQTGKELQSDSNRVNNLKTKSIFDNPDKEDGRRVSVMRWHYPAEKYQGRYHEWKKEFSPSAELLRSYKGKEIDWKEFEKKYVKEMEAKIPALKDFAERSRREVVTLLCAEHTDEKCHRRLLKNILEKFI